jgi:hypothetical protein
MPSQIPDIYWYTDVATITGDYGIACATDQADRRPTAHMRITNTTIKEAISQRTHHNLKMYGNVLVTHETFLTSELGGVKNAWPGV